MRISKNSKRLSQGEHGQKDLVFFGLFFFSRKNGGCLSLRNHSVERFRVRGCYSKPVSPLPDSLNRKNQHAYLPSRKPSNSHVRWLADKAFTLVSQLKF